MEEDIEEKKRNLNTTYRKKERKERTFKKNRPYIDWKKKKKRKLNICELWL